MIYSSQRPIKVRMPFFEGTFEATYYQEIMTSGIRELNIKNIFVQ